VRHCDVFRALTFGLASAEAYHRPNRTVTRKTAGEDKAKDTRLTPLQDAYQSAYFQCKLDGDKIPPTRAIQTLVQAWRETRGWSKRR
jgi:hypothetical protein